MSMPAERLSSRPHLAELLRGIADAPPVPVSDIASDSRRLCAGGAFLAVKGERSHGVDFAAEALSRNAAAIVWEDDGHTSFAAPADLVSIPVTGLSAHLGTIANRWFETPSADLRITGVTGTNGKTTVAFLIAKCLQLAGESSAYLGTLGAGTDTLDDCGGLTTPDCIELHRRLAGFRDCGAGSAAIEVSSHGLSQRRVDGVRFDAALFTNLTRDHIDYHGSMESYGETKARLFLEFEPALRLIGLDSDFGVELAHRCGDDAVLFASTPGHDHGAHRYLFATAVEATPYGAVVDIDSSFGTGRCRLPLYGQFNVANAAGVLAYLNGRGFDFDDGLELIGSVSAPPGRMQRVEHDTESAAPRVFVDYAHTPAALQAALDALRPHCRGALWCVFGCGGDRDRGKRPLMGEVVERLADRPVVTSDNPRSEDAASIIRDIRSGMRRDTIMIEDRATAIAYAIDSADDDDVVLVAGKGHENVQIIGDRRIDFSDYGAAEANLRARSMRRVKR